MSDPLSIPDDKRAGSGHRTLSKAQRERPWRREHPWSFWITIAVLVALNVWFDYHHFPIGIVLDVIIVLALFMGYGSVRDKT